MKLKFKKQQYQTDAAKAVIDCFEGQTKGSRKETVGRIGFLPEDIFSNKKIEIENELLKNVKTVQKEQNLKESKKLEVISSLPKTPNFSIEMETGTGKTYVYTKTMFELNKHYGWSKFIIMVPSVAIREGVYKSLQITADHFQEIYGEKIRFSIYNTKNKSNLVNIKNFARTSKIEVLIMNYQAFATKSKESRKIYQKLDVIESEKPIDIIKRARPILIIDEPQRFGKAEEHFKEFNPLCILRYSATHKKEKEFNKIYRLDAIDAFNQKLVKRINVKGIEVKGNYGTNSYLFLDRINISKNLFPKALLEFEIRRKSGIQKNLRNISEKDDLYQLSGELEQYTGFVVKEINGLTNKIIFTNGVEVSVGQSFGEADEKHLRRIQIRETIKSHLEKERLMHPKGIKVLSLFFIDEVAKYRLYDENNKVQIGEYAKIFEEEYKKAIQEQDFFSENFNNYLNNFSVEEIHNGYFSIDKKGRFVDSKEKRGFEGSDDESAYDLIMKNKERLLSLNEPTRFIFSHSALREGWDNPNVFQICTLKHSQSTISKRQEIGRGLRICVNSQGERMDTKVLESEFFDVNTLTVVASESYDNFAKELQKEILDSLSERPTKLTTTVLANLVVKNKKGEKLIFDETKAMNLIFEFRSKGYVNENYEITEKLIEDIESKKIELSEELAPFKDEIYSFIQSVHLNANFKATTDDRAEIKLLELKPNDNFAKIEFQDLWQKIKVKTVYEVDFDSEELIKKCVSALNVRLEVKKVKVQITGGEQKEKIDEVDLKAGESMKKTINRTEKSDSFLGAIKYDLVGEICKETKLTRKTIVRILQELRLDVFHNFKVNPESFIKEVSKIINLERAATLINNITYSKIDKTYSDDIFTINNFHGSLKENILKVKKHIYDFVKTDSKIERKFASDLEVGEILVYAKLPNDFKIPTPVGNYNPDWAIVFDSIEAKHIFFIAETKGSMESLQLKEIETRKINYAKKHFIALGNSEIKYDVISTYEELIGKVF